MTEGWRFDTAETFDADYLHFYAGILDDEASEGQADLLWRLLELEPGMRVLDVPCGHGRIANRLASRGAQVTGLDATALFLEHARRDAEARGVDVDYVEGDMRDLPFEAEFDAAACVFTSFGYFDDDENRRMLAGIRRALRPGGRFWIDVNNLLWLLANFRETHALQRDGDWMIDGVRYDLLSGRTITERTVVRGDRRRTFEFSVRMFTFSELRDWLLAAGFSRVDGYSGRGEELTLDSPRMVLVAHA
jgi:SAM-dependent methyltransferase